MKKPGDQNRKLYEEDLTWSVLWLRIFFFDGSTFRIWIWTQLLQNHNNIAQKLAENSTQNYRYLVKNITNDFRTNKKFVFALIDFFPA